MLNIGDELIIEISYFMDHGLLKSSRLLGLELVNNLLIKVQHPIIEQKALKYTWNFAKGSIIM